MLDAITDAARSVDADVTLEALDDETRWDAIVAHRTKAVRGGDQLRLARQDVSRVVSGRMCWRLRAVPGSQI